MYFFNFRVLLQLKCAYSTSKYLFIPYFPIFLEFEEFLEFAASSEIPLIPQIVGSSNSSDWGFLEDFL